MARRKQIPTKSTDKVYHSLSLLPMRVFSAVLNYLDYPVTDETHRTMEKLFRNYKKNKKEIKEALKKAFEYCCKDRYRREKGEKPLPYKKPKPTKEVVDAAKKSINEIAKRVWKN
jgi:HEPN domain-containing protein